ncbi:MAG: recombinase family protein [Planctomycetota bacterium]|jgi:DNA invertase Pin-like site-specific DNA recombinase
MDTSTRDEGARAAGYVRVSQERNVGRYSLGAQEIDVRRHAEFMRWGLVEIYREEGVSGYKRERPALGRMIADAEAGRFNVAVFPSLDRIARSVKDSIEIEKCFRDCGVSVVFVRENIDTGTAVGEFFRNVMSSIAEFEGHLMHERMLKGLRAKAARGGYTGTWLPYGYEAVDGEVVVVEAQAVIVRRIFEWRAEGRSLRRMSSELNATGVPTQHGRMWHPSVVWEIYRNRFYTGKSKARSGWVDGQHKAFVSKELFRKANAHNRKAG